MDEEGYDHVDGDGDEDGEVEDGEVDPTQKKVQ